MKTYVCVAYLGPIRAKYYIQASSKKKALKKAKEQYSYFKQWEVKSLKETDRSTTEFGAEGS